jgi:hypothetical protein
MHHILLLALTACFTGPECSTDADCPESYICNDVTDECDYGCRTDDDCPEDQECDLDTYECEAVSQDANSGA